MHAKIDNGADYEDKLELRRRMLKAFNPGVPLRVVDCFSGTERIWTDLKVEFALESYFALDIKRKRSRITLDSSRYLQGQRFTENIFDIDAYGSPWKHWLEVLKKPGHYLVFLTIGNTMFQVQQNEALRVLGITFPVPPGIQPGLVDMVAEACLGLATDNFVVVSALESIPPHHTSCRHIGLELKPKR